MPTVAPSIKAIGSEYVYQYVGAAFGGADAKFAASSLENPDGTYDFDNFASGWVELYNCVKGANLNVYNQNPTTSILQKHCVPLYQDLRITAKDTTGAAIENVRFNTTDVPNNSPTVTFITAGNLKTWDFRNPLSYETTTNASGIALSTPVLQVWYWQTSFKQNLRFPLSTATYQGRAYNYKTMNVSVVLGSNSIQDVSAGMVALDTATTVTETVASAITGITLTPSGATGGTITISSNKEYQDIWNYYRWWISQFANRSSNDTWTCLGGTLNTQNWNIVVNTGVTLTASTNISTLRTLGTVTLNGTAKITAVYQDNAGTSTVLEINPPSDDYSLCIFKADGTTKYFASDVNAGSYYVYFTPAEAGTYYLAAEKYGQKRTADTLVLPGGNAWYNITDQEDVGITDSKATASAYTTITNSNQFYDATAIFRLTESGIKKGQIVNRNGTNIEIQGFNHLIKNDATVLYAITGDTITTKGASYEGTSKYSKEVTDFSHTIEADTTEIITILIEDANGDSSAKLAGTVNNLIDVWKIPNTTLPKDFETGTLIDSGIGNGLYRFIHEDGFQLVFNNTDLGVVFRYCSMSKGDYELGWYIYNVATGGLTDEQSTLLNNIYNKEVIIQNKLDTDLDVKVSTRATTENVTDAKTEILEAIGEIPTTDISGLALEATSQDIKTKVLTLENYNDATTQNKLDALQTDVDNIENISGNIKDIVSALENTDLTGIATTENVTDAKTEILEAIGEIPTTDISLLALESTSQSIKTKVDTLENYDDTTLISKVDAIQTSVNDIDVDFTPVLEAVDLTLKADDYIAPDNSKIAEIKTKVDSLQNYNDATAQTKLDAIKAKTDVLVNTDLTGIATATDVTNAKTEILTAVNDIEIDNEAIANEVWEQQPERLKQVATVETTGEQIASFNTL
jgi:hypothetical protein